MNQIKRNETPLLFLGDLAVLFVSLYLTITLRYNALPNQDLLWAHLVPFSFLFTVSILLNFIVGLYEKHTSLLKKKIPTILLQVQIVNTIISIIFFYLMPYFSITPKFFLFAYLIISVVFMVAWRMSIAQSASNRRKNRALLLAQGKEVRELYEEVQHNSRYDTTFVEWIDTSYTKLDGNNLLKLIKEKEINLIVADFSNSQVNNVMPVLYSCIFSEVQFVDTQRMYEGIFDRIPLSLVNDSWFLENVSGASKLSFDLFKRLMDVVVSGSLGLISLIFYPFVYLAIKLDDRGVLFSYQDRIGEGNKIIRVMKFRTMSNPNDSAKWQTKEKNVVTRVGNFLRKSRIDELPQLWNVFKGDMSLIGPRPEFPGPVEAYAKEIPYYNIRHIVKPGLSGWAQIYGEHPHHGIDIDQTSNKLSHDLYYIKNRSITLDLKIALQTLKVLLSFVGR